MKISSPEVIEFAANPRVRNKAAYVRKCIAEAEAEAGRAEGHYQPGEQVTVDGTTYTVDEAGRLKGAAGAF
jgi:hypothetical protein